MGTSLFVLFKEYSDASNAPSAGYINSSDGVYSDNFLVYFDEWIKIVDFFQYERCDRYYDGRNIQKALYPYALLREEYEEQDDEYPRCADFVYAQLARVGLVDWRDEACEQQKVSYFYYDCDVTADTLGEMVRQKNSGVAVVFLNCDAITCSNPIEVSLSSKETVKIDHVCNISLLHKWFSENRLPQRIFDYNPKHGDKDNQAWMIAGSNRRAAQLEVSREEAQKLLNLAVGTDIHSALWYYDDVRKKHIYFENQQETRLAFHGYHLMPGEENYDNIDRSKLLLLHR